MLLLRLVIRPGPGSPAAKSRQAHESGAETRVAEAHRVGSEGRHLGMEAKREMVGDGLDRRASLEELTNQGIFQVIYVRAHRYVHARLLRLDYAHSLR